MFRRCHSVFLCLECIHKTQTSSRAGNASTRCEYKASIHRRVRAPPPPSSRPRNRSPRTHDNRAMGALLVFGQPSVPRVVVARGAADSHHACVSGFKLALRISEIIIPGTYI